MIVCFLIKKMMGYLIFSFFSICFVYTPFFPVNAETQPIITAFISIFLVIKFICLKLFYSESFCIKKIELLCLSIIGILFVYAFVDVIFGKYDAFFWAGKYALGPIVFFVVYRYISFPSLRVIKSVIFLNCFLLIASYIYGFNEIAHIFQSVYGRYTAFNTLRGFSFFSVEPSYAATYLFFILFFLYWYQRMGAINPLLSMVVLFLLLCTKSLLGFGYIFIYLVSFLKLKLFFVPFYLVLLPSVIYIFSLISERIEKITKIGTELFYTSSSFTDFIVNISLFEPSGSNRFIVNFISYAGGFFSFLGNGLGSFSSTWYLWASYFNMNFLSEHAVLGEDYIYKNEIPVQTYLGSLIYDTGLVGLIWFSLFFGSVFFSVSKTDKKSALLLFLTLLVFQFFQSQVTSPIFWTIIAFTCKLQNTFSHGAHK